MMAANCDVGDRIELVRVAAGKQIAWDVQPGQVGTIVEVHTAAITVRWDKPGEPATILMDKIDDWRPASNN